MKKTVFVDMHDRNIFIHILLYLTRAVLHLNCLNVTLYTKSDHDHPHITVLKDVVQCSKSYS